MGRNGAFYPSVSCFGAFTTFSDCTHDCTRLICLERLCLLCCCCYCCQRVNNCPLGVLRLTAGVGLQLHSRHNAGLWHNWHRHSTPCHSIRRLPAPGLELPPPGAFSSRRLSTHRRIGETARRNKFNISRILGPRRQYSSIYQRKRQLQTVRSRLHSLALALHW